MSDYKQIVTLTTDWMDKSYCARMLEDMSLPDIYPIGDHYVAQLKGCLRQLSSDIEIFDICNTVQAFSLLQTSYILRNTYPFFPKGAIHLIGVNSEPTATNKILVVKHDEHYFVGADNGLYDLIFKVTELELVYELVPQMMYKFVPDLVPKSFFDPDLELGEKKKFAGFSAIKIFATVINHIMNKREISLLGTPTTINRDRKELEVNAKDDTISGHVIFIDHFGNIITNITREKFESEGKGRSFHISVRGSKRFAITRISTDYTAVGNEHGYLAMFNSSGFLEIAHLNQNLAQAENISILAEVCINFIQERTGDLFA